MACAHLHAHDKALSVLQARPQQLSDALVDAQAAADHLHQLPQCWAASPPQDCQTEIIPCVSSHHNLACLIFKTRNHSMAAFPQPRTILQGAMQVNVAGKLTFVLALQPQCSFDQHAMLFMAS